jgi:hypothetical protein
MLGKSCCNFKIENALMIGLGFTNINVYIWAHLWVQCHYHHGFDYMICQLTKGPTCESNVCINVSSVPNFKMVTHGLIICSTIVICMFMICESIQLVEPINFTCGYWSLTIGSCTSMGVARGIYDQWMYFVWGGLGSPFAIMHCWVAQWCLYPHYLKLVVPKFQH